MENAFTKGEGPLSRPAGYVPETRACVCTIWRGTGGPIPVVIPTLVCVITGLPMTFTRVEGTVHCAGTHGAGIAGGVVNGHPAIRIVHAWVATNAPPAFTRVFFGMIFA